MSEDEAVAETVEYIPFGQCWRRLWPTFQDVMVEKWFQKNPTLLEFDERLQYYTKTVNEVSAMTMFKDQDFIRFHMEPLADSIKQHARLWLQAYGKVLQESASQALAAIRDQLQVSYDQSSLKSH